MARGIVIGLVLGVMLTLGGVAVADGIFSDVGPDNTHAAGIQWAFENGLIEGFDDGTFRPGQAVTRGQLASILERQRATRHPTYLLTPQCGERTMRATVTPIMGTDPATVEFSVDGGDRITLPGGIPEDGLRDFDPGASGLVSLFVDSLAVAHAPTGEACTPPA